MRSVLSLLKKEKMKGNIGSIQSWDIERKESSLLIKEQQDYPGRFKVYFRMSGTQFDALQVILEPHIKNKTSNFCGLSVQGSLWCFVLRDKVNLTQIFYSLIAILDFFCFFVFGSELSKHLSKFLQQMWNILKIVPDPIYLWWTKGSGECVNVIDKVMSHLFFNKGKFQMKSLDSVCCAMSIIYN